MKLHESRRHSIFGLLFFLSNRLQTIGDSFFAEVTTKQWFILLVIKLMSDREPTLSELATVAGSSRQNVKQIVLKLEQKGFVELTKDQKDARRFRIKLTPKYKEFQEAYHPRSNEFIERIFQNLDESCLDITLNSLITLKENLEKEYNDDTE